MSIDIKSIKLDITFLLVFLAIFEGYKNGISPFSLGKILLSDEESKSRSVTVQITNCAILGRQKSEKKDHKKSQSI